MKKILLTVSSLCLISSLSFGHAWNRTSKSCALDFGYKYRSFAQVDYLSTPAGSLIWTVVGYADTDGDGHTPTAGDTPIYGWATTTSDSWVKKAYDVDRACKGVAYAEAEWYKDFGSPTGWRVGHAIAKNSSAGEFIVTQYSNHMAIRAGATSSTSTIPHGIDLDKVNSVVAKGINDFDGQFAKISFEEVNLTVSNETYVGAVLKVLIVQNNNKDNDTESFDDYLIISESKVEVVGNSIIQTGVFEGETINQTFNQDGTISYDLGKANYSIEVPDEYKDLDNISLVIYADGGYQEISKSYKTEAPTSIVKMQHNNPALSVFPNPVTNNTLNVSINGGDNQNSTKVELRDNSGRLVKSVFEGKYLNEKMQVDVSNLATGIYYLNIINGSYTRREKVEVIH